RLRSGRGARSSIRCGRQCWVSTGCRARRPAKIRVFNRRTLAMSMADRDGWIWYDGKMVPWRDATTHVLTHTLHYGMGVFEGVRCYDTARGPSIFRLRDHTDRFVRSAQIFGMKIPYDKDTLDAAQKACVRDNGLKSCYLRP